MINNYKADWHIHTYYSDGTSSPESILKLVEENNIKEIGIVDHDTVFGHQHCLKVFSDSDVKLHLGVEISAYDFKRHRKVHLLAYDMEDTGPIEEICYNIIKQRTKVSQEQLFAIQEAGFSITYEEVAAKAKYSTAIYKQHIMSVLIDKGYTDMIYGDLYKKLFKNNGVACKDIEYVDIFDAMYAVKESKGISVLAHPGQLNSYELISELVPFGLNGVEKYHPDHTKEDHKKVQNYIEKYNLSIYGGSDFHGDFGPDYFGKSVLLS